MVGDSRLAFSGFDVSRVAVCRPASQGARMLLDHGLLATPGRAASRRLGLTSSGNGGPGFWLAANGSMESPFGTARLSSRPSCRIQLGRDPRQ